MNKDEALRDIDRRIDDLDTLMQRNTYLSIAFGVVGLGAAIAIPMVIAARYSADIGISVALTTACAFGAGVFCSEHGSRAKRAGDTIMNLIHTRIMIEQLDVNVEPEITIHTDRDT